MEDVYLKDIKHEYHPKEDVYEWEFLEIKDSESRIYFKPNKDKGLGFDFYAINKTGHVCNEHTEKDGWNKEYCMVECVFRGIAYFDGIRHLYYGDEKTENYGYHYYADLEMIEDIVKGLRELEKKYCRYYNG